MESNDQFVRRANVMRRRRGVMVGGRQSRPTSTTHGLLGRHPHNRASIKCHQVYNFVVATLIALLLLKYSNEKAFETHLSNILTFVILMCTYCLAEVGKILTKNYGANWSTLFVHVSNISGAISSVSLAVTFLPSSVSSKIMFIIWVLLLAIVALYLCKAIYQWFCRKIVAAVVRVLQLFATFMGREGQRLPVYQSNTRPTSLEIQMAPM